ncbi:MAG TPA: Asp-tRNA(Asn)/Glu-tRNA(Gln) amidotransferase subunit GatC [Candidatus Saccharimonadales bacterium]|nr:Asp-tRNA(Asn)/Glu-tRNA(Gln) amidotransferase subunit GatC [Candidatus Saccharimonadales bacterium]
MTKLTKKDTLHVSKLAKLDLTDREIDKFTTQLSNVLDHVSELSKVNTDSVEATAQTTGLTNVLREDEIDVTNCLTQDEALSGTENTDNGFIATKAILSK